MKQLINTTKFFLLAIVCGAIVWATFVGVAHMMYGHDSSDEMQVGDEVTLTDRVYYDTDSAYCDYTPEDFKQNYAIDLKPDGYLILDEDSNVYYVPFKDLEVWFLEMNM